MVDSLIRLVPAEPAPAPAASSKIRTEVKQARMKRFGAIHVLSGSATRDENGHEFARVCMAWGLGEKDCSYTSAMHTNSETVAALYSYLRTMNPDWLQWRVGILQEANTAFGLSFDFGGARPHGR